MDALTRQVIAGQGQGLQLVPVQVTQVSPLQVLLFGGTVNAVGQPGVTYVTGPANALLAPGVAPLIFPNNPTAVDAYTKAQTNSLVASPGAIAPTTVTASSDVSSAGRVSSNGAPVLSVPSHNFSVVSSYVACWINGDGQFGTSASTVNVKKDLTPMVAADVATKLDSLTPYWGRYVWDAETDPLKVFLLAEDVKAAGFGPDVAPVVEGPDPQNVATDANPILVQPGDAYTINYSQLVVPLLAYAQALETRITALETRLAAAGIA